MGLQSTRTDREPEFEDEKSPYLDVNIYKSLGSKK